MGTKSANYTPLASVNHLVTSLPLRIGAIAEETTPDNANSALVVIPEIATQEVVLHLVTHASVLQGSPAPTAKH
jgi:hypothetical protein